MEKGGREERNPQSSKRSLQLGAYEEYGNAIYVRRSGQPHGGDGELLRKSEKAQRSRENTIRPWPTSETNRREEKRESYTFPNWTCLPEGQLFGQLIVLTGLTLKGGGNGLPLPKGDSLFYCSRGKL